MAGRSAVLAGRSSWQWTSVEPVKRSPAGRASPPAAGRHKGVFWPTRRSILSVRGDVLVCAVPQPGKQVARREPRGRGNLGRPGCTRQPEVVCSMRSASPDRSVVVVRGPQPRGQTRWLPSTARWCITTFRISPRLLGKSFRSASRSDRWASRSSETQRGGNDQAGRRGRRAGVSRLPPVVFLERLRAGIGPPVGFF